MRNWYFLLGFIFLSCLVGYFIVYQKKLVSQPIRADAEGYYAYLPAFFIYKDWQMKKVDLYQPDAQSFTHPPIYTIKATGNNVDKYPMGVALLTLPFFLLAHLTSFLADLPKTGYTLIYQHLVGISGILYLVAGLIFLEKLYKKYFTSKIVYLTLISLVLATNLFHYATFDSLMSHVFSFFLISFFLYLVDIWSKKATVFNSIIIGMLVGLIFLTRNINLVFALILLPFLRKNIKYFPVLIIFSMVVVLPQFLYWYYASGHFLFISYQGEKFYFTQPKIYHILLSPRKGILFWSPIFLLSLLGFKALKKKLKSYFIWLVAILLINLFLIASWYDWAFGASFGNRAFIDSYPILGLFLAAFFENFKNKKLTLVLIVCLVFLNITNMIKYWQRILPYDQVSLDIYLKNLFILKK